MRHVFTPIANADKYRYILMGSYAGSDNRFAINSRFRYYETLGDGSTAHTPDMPVPLELLADYLYSMAYAMGSEQNKRELADAAAFELRHRHDDKIAFASTVKYKDDGKVRYYSSVERKVTTSESKRHDRRYEEVREWADGSVQSAFRVLAKDFWSPWDSFVLYDAIAEWYRQNNLPSMDALRYMGSWRDALTEDGQRDLESGYAAAKAMMRAIDAQSYAERLIRHYNEALAERAEKVTVEG